MVVVFLLFWSLFSLAFCEPGDDVTVIDADPKCESGECESMNFEDLKSLAYKFHEEGKYADSLVYFSNAMQLATDVDKDGNRVLDESVLDAKSFAEFLTVRVSALSISGKMEEALADTDLALTYLDPEKRTNRQLVTTILHHRGIIFRALQQFDKAEESFTQALLKIDPNKNGAPRIATEKTRSILSLRGWVRISLRKYEEAINDFNAILLENDRDLSGLHGSALCYYSFGQAETAVSLVSIALRVARDERIMRDDLHLLRAQWFLHAEKFQDAIADCDAALEILKGRDPEDFHATSRYVEGYVSRGYARLQLGQFQESLDDYNVILESNGEFAESNAVFLTNYGSALWKVGELDKAEEALLSAVEIDPKYVVPHRLLAHVLMSREKFQQLLDHFDANVEQFADTPDIFVSRAFVLRSLERFDEAIEQFDELLEMGTEKLGEENTIVTWRGRGTTFASLDNCSEAVEDLSKVLGARPREFITFHIRADCYRKMEKWSEAISDYTRAVELIPDDALAVFNRGQIWKKLGVDAIAEADLALAAELKPKFLGNLESEDGDRIQEFVGAVSMVGETDDFIDVPSL